MRRWHDHWSPSHADLTKPVMDILRHAPEVEVEVEVAVTAPAELREAVGKKFQAWVEKMGGRLTP